MDKNEHYETIQRIIGGTKKIQMILEKEKLSSQDYMDVLEAIEEIHYLNHKAHNIQFNQ